MANLPGGFSYFAKFGNDLNVVLEAVAGLAAGLTCCLVRVFKNVPRSSGGSVYRQHGPLRDGCFHITAAAPDRSSQYTQLEVGIHLQVLPLINPDGLVVMDIQADVEQLGPGVQIAGVGSVPTTTMKRQAGAKVAVAFAETIILGGFISDSRTTSDSGIPASKDIPGLGNLFKSRSSPKPAHRTDHAHASHSVADTRRRRSCGDCGAEQTSVRCQTSWNWKSSPG